MDYKRHKPFEAVPVELRTANEFIRKLHRHHLPVYRDKFRLGCLSNGILVGVIQAARPVARHLDNGTTLEVIRCCTDGTQNACTFLLGRIRRIAPVSYTHLRAHETGRNLVCRLLLEKKKKET